ATRFVDGFPLGNGSLGAVLRGGAGEEHLDLNVDTLWSGGPLPPATGPAPHLLLPELRAAVAAGDFPRADELARGLQGPGWSQSYQPLGALDWAYAPAGGASGYRRELDVAEALASTAFDTPAGPVRLETFVSAPDAVLVATATGPGTAAVVAPRWDSPHAGADVRQEEAGGVSWTTVTGRAPAHVTPNYVEDADPVRYADDEPDADGTVAAGTGYAVVVAVQRDGDGQRLIAAAVSGFRGATQRPSADVEALAAQARTLVEAALTQPTAVLRARHREEHRGYFDRVDLQLPPDAAAAAEFFWHYGRYLLISSSRPGTQAATLQGIWNADVRPAWSCNYTTNINVEMNYWPAEAVALADVAEPLFDLAADLAVQGRATAARVYGAAGSAVHHNTDVWRFSTPVPGDPCWANWPSALPWIAAHLSSHVEHCADADEARRARSRALPVLRAASAFALDVLVPDADGALVVSPSTSPEHAFLLDGRRAVVSAGTAMDQELVREVLTSFATTVAAGTGDARPGDPDAAGDEALAARARTALDALRPVATGADGALLEWAQERVPQEVGHRHVSHLYGLYPGTRITEQGTPADFEAARRALRSRIDGGSGYTGWSQAWILCLAARLRDTGLAERSLDVLLDDLTSDSLLDLHPHGDWPGGSVFQIDGNFGAVAGMTELLVQSHDGAIALLRTVPRAWSSGRVRGIRCRGGARVDVAWSGGAATEVVVVNGPGEHLVLEVPGTGAGLSVQDGSGAAVGGVEVTGSVPGRSRLSWPAAAGATYRLTAA
ncbi:glycoside hydrolase family 95 protein, partial [Kineococcus sp. R8]|uniref:glycoside hydrolase family 95 protein n=1 Tax=Kineococcus siccus TaxID=2696567 RepID=UPI001412E258